jgi:hypothetical protein
VKEEEENTHSQPLRGTVKDPEFRHRRASAGGRARCSIDTYIRSIAAAPELTEAQKDELRRILRLSSRAEPAT